MRLSCCIVVSVQCVENVPVLFFFFFWVLLSLEHLSTVTAPGAQD